MARVSARGHGCYIIWQMRKLGIHARLDQVFDAPAAVKEVLISQSGLDHSVCSPPCSLCLSVLHFMALKYFVKKFKFMFSFNFFCHFIATSKFISLTSFLMCTVHWY